MDAELSERMVELRQLEQQLRIITVQQIPGADREHKHATITRGEIEVLPEDVRTYNGVGRMFVLQDKAATLAQIDARIAATTGKKQELAKLAKTLETAHTESKKAVEDLLRAKATK